MERISDGAHSERPVSRIENFRNLSPAERIRKIGGIAGLNQASQKMLSGGALPVELANGMIENVVGTFELPLGVATNFTINGRDYLVPMAVEEPSVVAAASYMARIARGCGGFHTSSTSPVMRAQIQVLSLKDPYGARQRLIEAREVATMAAYLASPLSAATNGAAIKVEGVR